MLHALRAIVLRIATSSVQASSTALARYIEQPTAQQHWSAKTYKKSHLGLSTYRMDFLSDSVVFAFEKVLSYKD